MVYHEINCIICGVSLSLARIRRPSEPREAAWDFSGSSNPGTSFIQPEAEFFEDYGECPSANQDFPGQEGCMVAFREDYAWAERGREAIQSARRYPEKTWDEHTFRGLEEERLDLEIVEEQDENWVPNAEEQAMSEEMMSYEYDDADTTCSEILSDCDSEIESGAAEVEDPNGYRAWLTQATQKPEFPGRWSGDYDSEQTRKLQQLAEEFRAKVPHEVQIPWLVEINKFPEPLRTTLLNDNEGWASLGEGDPNYRVPSWLGHPLEKLGIGEEGCCWEHLAGPECRVKAGYQGTRISLGEMRNCNIAQALVRSRGQSGRALDDMCEDWEMDGSSKWYLSGLIDQAGDMEGGFSEPYPKRREGEENDYYAIDCGNWDSVDGMVAMPFHPTCLEIFKRASVKRCGRFDISALGDWWFANIDYDAFYALPRADDVSRARSSEWWEHDIGCEYLAANPCIVPTLRDLLKHRKKRTTKTSPIKEHGLSILPIEIQHIVMSHLALEDIAALNIAYPPMHSVIENILKSRLLTDTPWLWEFWCNMPYSRWFGTTAAEAKAAHDAFVEQEDEITRILKILEEEGHHEAHTEYKQYWNNGLQERKEKAQACLQQKPTGFVHMEDLDLCKFVRELSEAQKNDRIKGLKNRERIWVDCNMILDRIEDWQDTIKNRQMIFPDETW